MNYLINFENFKLYEKFSLELYQKVTQRILKDLKLNLNYVTTFGAVVTAFYPLIETLINNGTLNEKVTLDMVILLTLGAVSIVLHESKTEIDKIKTYLKEYGWDGLLDKVVDVFINLQKIFPKLIKYVLNMTDSVVIRIMDMFSYTALLVPFLHVLKDIITQHNINIDNLPNYLMSVGIGGAVLIGKNIISELLDRVKKLISKNKNESLVLEQYKLIKHK